MTCPVRQLVFHACFFFIPLSSVCTLEFWRWEKLHNQFEAKELREVWPVVLATFFFFFETGSYHYAALAGLGLLCKPGWLWTQPCLPTDLWVQLTSILPPPALEVKSPRTPRKSAWSFSRMISRTISLACCKNKKYQWGKILEKDSTGWKARIRVRISVTQDCEGAHCWQGWESWGTATLRFKL